MEKVDFGDQMKICNSKKSSRKIKWMDLNLQIFR